MLNTGTTFSVRVEPRGKEVYSTVIVRLEFPQSRKQNTNSTSVQFFGRISRCTESMSLIKVLPKLAGKAPLEKYQFYSEISSIMHHS